jgi:hypothetical protein
MSMAIKKHDRELVSFYRIEGAMMVEFQNGTLLRYPVKEFFEIFEIVGDE